jgi:hypothetical protein
MPEVAPVMTMACFERGFSLGLRDMDGLDARVEIGTARPTGGFRPLIMRT